MDRETQKHRGRMPCEDRGRDWSDATTSQGMPRIAGNHQKQAKRHGTDSPSEPGKEPTLLTSWFQTSSLQNCEREISVALSYPVSGNLSRQP